jgi:galactokinase
VQHRQPRACGAYNELRQNCDSAATKLGAKSLRPVEMKQLQAGKGLTVREYGCAHHVVSETRAVAAERLARR